MSARRPTPEQDAAVAAFRDGDHLVLQAGAGTGKTTTLTMLGKATCWQGRYIAFNKAIAAEAEKMESRLAYVAVTRAQHQLDLGALSWANQHPDGSPPRDR
ncbi:AAA family ATPase [Amycolatopsis sp. NPDC004169]|uniref:AAA family ATPase n=1 Tax=Amycolatopsis sp. NPDC004169 TaxID=3154453 RepID=UPI0033A1BAD4